MKQKSRHQTICGVPWSKLVAVTLSIIATITILAIVGGILRETVHDVRNATQDYCRAQCCGCVFEMHDWYDSTGAFCTCTHAWYDFDTQECVMGRYTAFTKPERFRYECNLTLSGAFQP